MQIYFSETFNIHSIIGYLNDYYILLFHFLLNLFFFCLIIVTIYHTEERKSIIIFSFYRKIFPYVFVQFDYFLRDILEITTFFDFYLFLLKNGFYFSIDLTFFFSYNENQVVFFMSTGILPRYQRRQLCYM